MKKMNIDLEYAKLVMKYGVYRDEPELRAIYQGIITDMLFNGIFENIPEGKQIVFFGADAEARQILKKLSDVHRARIGYVLDKTIGYNLPDVKVISLGELKKRKLTDYVVVASGNQVEEIKAELLPLMSAKSIIDIHDVLAQYDMFYQDVFVEETVNEYRHITYLDVNNAICYYEQCDDDEKAFYLRRVIAFCLEIRDFIHAKKYIEQYIFADYEGKRNYVAFANELKKMLERISSIVKIRTQKDVIVNWVDNVNAEEFYATNFAHSLKGKACFFTNAFTSAPWTHYTHESIFRAKMAISGKTYRREKLNVENSPFLKIIKEHDYNFYYVANPRVYQAEFGEDMLPEMPRGFDKLIRYNRADSECSTRLQWIALKQRLLSEKPVCIWIHNLCETHWPMWFVGKKNLLHQSIEYLQLALKFLTNQLDWYAQFKSPNQQSIYLSDHGNARLTDRGGNTQAFERARSNIAMVIVSPYIKPGTMSRFYSHTNFWRVLEELLNDNQNMDWDKICSDYVLFETVDYSASEVDTIPGKFAKWGNIDFTYYQMKGIRTEKDIYAHYAFGKEFYFVLPDLRKNEIGNTAYKDRIDELRGLVTREFIDIDKVPEFKHSRVLYDYLKGVPENKIRW